MALFKFRKGRDEQPAPSKKKKPAPTVEAVRRRAMHRLIGSAVLVLAGVIGFPLIFDNQPRPIPVDLPIEIVDRNKVKPLVAPPAAAAAESAAAAPAKEAAAALPAPVAASPAAPPASAAPTPTTTTTSTTTTAAAAPAAPKPASEVPETRALDAKKARALLEGRTPVAEAPARTAAAEAAKPPAKPAAASDERYVVQVGAFADPAKVREVRRKVEAAGLKTYTQVVGTSDGDRTRVRVGPFSDRTEADKAAEKIRKLNLTAAILTL